METENVMQYLNNKTVLITGVTGFLAKVLVEKILRVQPDVEKLYLLIRVGNKTSAWERLNDEVIGKDLFRVLREKHGNNFDTFISRKVIPIAGDTTLPDLGVNDDYGLKEMCNNIDAIIHVAATTKFNERYDAALHINTLGPRNVMDFAKKCSKLQILVHVSTAYVCGDQKTGVIPETPMKMGETLNGAANLDIDVEKRLVDKMMADLKAVGASEEEIRDTMKRLGKQRAQSFGWPNVYVFTKAMGEMLVSQHRGNLPVAIIRPTMVCCTYKEPFPGWVEGVGSLAFMTSTYGKSIGNFMNAGGANVPDLIPVDMVVNAAIMAMVVRANQPSLTVYQVGSSSRNPVTLGTILDVHFHYFRKRPWVDERGTAIKVGDPRVVMIQSKFFFKTLLVLQLFMLMVLKALNLASGHYFKATHDHLEMWLKANVKIAEVYSPFLRFRGIFDDDNTKNLRIAMRQRGMDEDIFGFDPKCIDWEEYLGKMQIPGVIKYLF